MTEGFEKEVAGARLTAPQSALEKQVEAGARWLWTHLTRRGHGLRVLSWAVRILALATGIWITFASGSVFLHVVNQAYRELFSADGHAIGRTVSEVNTLGDVLGVIFSSHAAREGAVAVTLAFLVLVMIFLAAATLALSTFFFHRTYWTLRTFLTERPGPLSVSVRGLGIAEAPQGQAVAQGNLFGPPTVVKEGEGPVPNPVDWLRAHEESIAGIEAKLESLEKSLRGPR